MVNYSKKIEGSAMHTSLISRKEGSEKTNVLCIDDIGGSTL